MVPKLHIQCTHIVIGWMVCPDIKHKKICTFMTYSACSVLIFFLFTFLAFSVS